MDYVSNGMGDCFGALLMFLMALQARASRLKAFLALFSFSLSLDFNNYK